MDYRWFFTDHRMDRDRALKEWENDGNGVMSIRRQIDGSGFSLKLTIDDKSTDVRVFDEEGSEYILFNVRDSGGSFISEIREKADKTLSVIRDEYFTAENMWDKALKFAHDEFGTVPVKPFSDDDETMTLNTASNNKWYAILMNISLKHLDEGREGNADVINLKVSPERIPEMTDFIHIFPAYHMNKKHWISVMLDEKLDMEMLRSLLRESYRLVERTKKR